MLMLMLMLWPEAVTPGVSHVAAYLRPPDSHFSIYIYLYIYNALVINFILALDPWKRKILENGGEETFFIIIYVIHIIIGVTKNTG